MTNVFFFFAECDRRVANHVRRKAFDNAYDAKRYARSLLNDDKYIYRSEMRGVRGGVAEGAGI